jgi:hypothetical protein
LRRPIDGPADDPAVDLGYQPIFLGSRQEGARRDDLAVAADHAQEHLFCWVTAAEGYDRL